MKKDNGIMDPLQENRAKWDKRAPHYDTHERSKFFTAIQRNVIDTIGLEPGMRFLDLGCGTGWGVKYAYDKVRGQGAFYGVDISGKMIALAKEKYKDLPSIEFIQSPAEAITIEPQTVDRIICTNSFHHYSNHVAVLMNVYKVLKTGGVIAIADVTTDTLFTRLLNRLLKWSEKGHVTFYNTGQYAQLFQQTGLTYSTKVLGAIIKVHIGKKL